MKNISLPVSRLTRALMVHQYGREPIRLDRADIRRKELAHVGTSNKHMERKSAALNTTIILRVNEHEADHLVGRLPEVGYYLYQQDKIRIFRFVWSRVTAGLPALQSIYDYYDLHDIEEDDFPIDTAERLWKRWRVEKEKERLPNTPQSVPYLATVLLSERQAEEVTSRLSKFISEGCIQMDPRYSDSAAAWVFCDLTPLTHDQVALRLRRHRQSISRSASRFRDYMEYNDDLRKLVAYCLKTTHARPTPSVAS